VDLRHARDVRNSDLVGCDAYNAAKLAVKSVYVEYPATRQDMVAKNEVGVV
jgi:hypothetical protein